MFSFAYKSVIGIKKVQMPSNKPSWRVTKYDVGQGYFAFWLNVPSKPWDFKTRRIHESVSDSST